MPKVASASALKPIATRTPLIAITAEHALCSTINRRLVTLTSHVRRRTGSSTGAVAASTESLVSRAISYQVIAAQNPCRVTALLCRLLREVSDKRDLVALSLTRLDHHKDPEDQKCQPHRE